MATAAKSDATQGKPGVILGAGGVLLFTLSQLRPAKASTSLATSNELLMIAALGALLWVVSYLVGKLSGAGPPPAMVGGLAPKAARASAPSEAYRPLGHAPAPAAEAAAPAKQEGEKKDD